MAIGRISGSVLKSNLTRNGTDLAFETNLLYLDVTNSRVGIGTSEPSTALHVNGTVTASAITGLTSATITNTSTDDSILVTTTENSSTAGPVISLKRNSGSPADSDYLGQIKFKGENDADQEVNYAKITGKILDASDGSEDGIIEFAHVKGGSQVITGRWRSDSLQLLNGTHLTVAGNATVTGSLTASSLAYPTSDGSAGQVIKTDGSGTLSFTTISTNSVSQGNSNVTVTDSGTGAITIAADGNTIITMNATTALDVSAVTNAIRLPNGTTGQRPSGSVGMVRYNSSTDNIEGYTSAGGWAQLGSVDITGRNTAIHHFVNASGIKYAALGTNRILYAYSGGIFYDIHPIKSTTTLTSAFSTTNGSSTVTITFASAHNANKGDIILINVNKRGG